MRSDMGKVLVERPRIGRWRGDSRPGKGYSKRLAKCLDAGDSPPVREGIKRRYSDTKSFNEHLAPLRRFLQSNVGRPWDKVYSEICRHVDRGNVVQKHILTHLFEYVVTDAILIDGVPCRGASAYRSYGESLRTTRNQHLWYVCPKSGLLRRSRYIRPGRRAVEPPRRVVLNKSQMCLYLDGQWELVTVKPIPNPVGREPIRDVVRNRDLRSYNCRDGGAIRFYGSEVYATGRRPLSRRELLALPIPVEWLP